MLNESRCSPGWGPGLGETSCPRSLLSAGFRGFEVLGDGTGVPRTLCTTGRLMGYEASCPLGHWSNPPLSPKGDCRCLKLSASKRKEMSPVLNLKGKRNLGLGRWSFAHPSLSPPTSRGDYGSAGGLAGGPGDSAWGQASPRPRPPPACAALRPGRAPPPGPRLTPVQRSLRSRMHAQLPRLRAGSAGRNVPNCQRGRAANPDSPDARRQLVRVEGSQDNTQEGRLGGLGLRLLARALGRGRPEPLNQGRLDLLRPDSTSFQSQLISGLQEYTLALWNCGATLVCCPKKKNFLRS